MGADGCGGEEKEDLVLPGLEDAHGKTRSGIMGSLNHFSDVAELLP